MGKINTIQTTEAKEQFSELINRVTQNNERIVLTRRGKGVAALIPFADLALLTENQHQQDLLDAKEALEQTRKQGALSLNTFKDRFT